MTKYGSNEDLEITQKHVEMAKQGENEGFGRVYQPPPVVVEKKAPVAEVGNNRVLEQLKKTQVHITIWVCSLLLNPTMPL